MTTIGGGRGMGRRPAAAMPQAEDEDSLYFIVRTGRVSLQQTVDDWIEEYKVGITPIECNLSINRTVRYRLV